MNDQRQDSASYGATRGVATPGVATRGLMEIRSRELFSESVDALDMRLRSRLTQARYAALEAASLRHRRPWLLLGRVWTPAGGVAAALLLGAVLWVGLPVGNRGMMAVDAQANLEDLDMVASSEENSGDALEMLQNDLDFYDFSDKATTPGSGPAA